MPTPSRLRRQPERRPRREARVSGRIKPPVDACRQCGACAFCGRPVSHVRCVAKPGGGDVMWGPRRQHEAACLIARRTEEHLKIGRALS